MTKARLGLPRRLTGRGPFAARRAGAFPGPRRAERPVAVRLGSPEAVERAEREPAAGGRARAEGR